MAVSKSVRIIQINNLFNYSTNFSKISFSCPIYPVRYLRGSRYSKNDNAEEIRFQRLLRSLRNPSTKSSSSTITVSSEATPLNIQECDVEHHDVETSNLVTSEDLVKRLEEKFTPLKGIRYTRQLERKYKKSLVVLRSLGERLQALKVPIAMGSEKLPCPVDIVLPSPVVNAYRSKDEFNIGLGLDGCEKTVGFFLDAPSEFSTTFCISAKEISIVRENHKKIAQDFQNYLQSSPLSASQHFSDGGYWKKIVVRSNTDGDLMAVIVMHPQNLTQDEILAEKDKLKAYFLSLPKNNYNLNSLYFQLCTQSKCTHEQSPYELLLGEPTLIEDYHKIKLHLSPDSFFPANPKAAEAMHNALLKLCRVNSSMTVVDIHCGPGPVSFLFSPRVRRCIGIDDSTLAIRDAKMNSKENGLKNTEFFCGRIDTTLREVLSNDYHEDILAIINISGSVISKSVINTLREFKNMKKIIFMSTKPNATLDHFVQLCRPGGSSKNLGKPFLPILAVPVDLYPQTDHYGLIVMFQRL